MLFLGTGAAELYPNPYCDCETCSRARAQGAIPRKRTAFMIDEHNVVDFGPDVLAASMQYNASFAKLDHVFITHTHEDHLCFSNITALTMAAFRTRFPICFYMSEKAYDWSMRMIKSLTEYPAVYSMNKLFEMGRVKLCPVTPYTTFTVGDMKITTVESNHKASKGEFAINYLFDRGEKGKLLYVTDSGLWSEKNVSFLAGAKADTLIMEGTMGSVSTPRDGGHMNAEHFVEQVAAFMENGVLKPDAKVYMTHINQVNRFSHEEYQAYCDTHSRYPITIAYDGMKIDR